MKTATILPQAYLKFVVADDYHMALAHLIGKDGYEEYTEFFRHVGHTTDNFLLMDTGLIEGDPRPIDELVEKAKLIMATEMILPDVFRNKNETLRESHEALQYVQEHYPEIRRMVVPQGESLDEWIECAKEMLTWDIHTIGVPKVLVHLEQNTHARLEALIAIQEHLGDKEIHLLGCWDSPLELKTIENYVHRLKMKPVRGVDSAIAFAYAEAGLRITDDARPQKAIDFLHTGVDESLLDYNIAVWRHESKSFTARTKSNIAYML